MLYRLVALDEGPDIPVDREMVIIGRHPQCDARLDSIRISRRHCCMFQDDGEVIVRDLGSTNGIRINGQRVEKGRLRLGDELSIAHIRYRLDDGQGQELTLAEPSMVLAGAAHGHGNGNGVGLGLVEDRDGPLRPLGAPGTKRNLNGPVESNPLAAAVREMLPPGVGDRCRIQVIVQMQPEDDSGEPPPAPPADSDPPSDDSDGPRPRDPDSAR
jgi:hypothetical protein